MANKKAKEIFDPNNDKHIKTGMTISFLLIIVIAIYGITLLLPKDNYKNMKEDETKEIVYSKYQSGSKDIPYVNMKDEVFKQINEDIDKFTNESNTTKVTYKYNISGIVLSLIISRVDIIDELPKVYFRSYNINLETKENVSNKAVLNYYRLTNTDVNQLVENKFREHYKNETKKDYIVLDECDFNCYLDMRKYEVTEEDYSYYIDKGNLKVFIPFNVYSIYGEEDYFKDSDYEFYLTSAPEE